LLMGKRAKYKMKGSNIVMFSNTSNVLLSTAFEDYCLCRVQFRGRRTPITQAEVGR
jgi:hypothetical protein